MAAEDELHLRTAVFELWNVIISHFPGGGGNGGNDNGGGGGGGGGGRKSLRITSYIRGASCITVASSQRNISP